MLPIAADSLPELRASNIHGTETAADTARTNPTAIASHVFADIDSSSFLKLAGMTWPSLNPDCWSRVALLDL